MDRNFSTFLDLTRLSAATAVFLAHLSYPQFGGEALAWFGPHAHSAVVVFFVLSGYVIAWTAQRDGTLTGYAINRAARIYSVALPALALTWAIDIAMGTQSYQHAQPWKYLPVFLSFTTDFWFLSENAFSNAPYWSLCYEVWYYVVFGLFVFGRGVWRWALPGLCLLAMGPRLWLLLPIWLAGVAVLRLHQRVTLERDTAIAVFILSLAGIFAIKGLGVDLYVNEWLNAATGGFAKSHLRYSSYFLGDYMFAACVAGLIFAARDAALPIVLARKWIAAAASVSFTLYLAHYPLLLGFGALFPGNPWLIGAGTLVAVVVLGVAFERRKDVVKGALVWALRRRSSLAS
jgi:peptidoglycan/LPS O-acetylase OafA/YrhL